MWNSPTISNIMFWVFVYFLFVLLILRGTDKTDTQSSLNIGKPWYICMCTCVCICVWVVCVWKRENMHAKIARYLYTFIILARMPRLKHLKSYFQSHLFLKGGTNFTRLGILQMFWAIFLKCLGFGRSQSQSLPSPFSLNF